MVLLRFRVMQNIPTDKSVKSLIHNFLIMRHNSNLWRTKKRGSLLTKVLMLPIILMIPIAVIIYLTYLLIKALRIYIKNNS